ncbi:MAG TPA: hypothetical protein PKO06_00130 [Candidatus Ozemobacteraceae bacterium]|nr:hypothetical protein [Candidatus Ozemobacteraceae bacterium]
MKNVVRVSAGLGLLLLALVVVQLVGCGQSGTPTPPATPAAPAAAVATVPTVSALDILKSFDTDQNKAQTEFASKTIKLVNVIANTHWEDDKLLELSVYNPDTKEAGGIPSETVFRGAPLKQMVCPFFFKVRIDDPKLIEGIKCSTTNTVEGKAVTELFDVLEIECEFDKFVEGEIIFKNPKITKK